MWNNPTTRETRNQLQEMTYGKSDEPNADWPDPDTERAQPGDVLGIERGGETTSQGDTEEDEDRRRREALEDEAFDNDE